MTNQKTKGMFNKIKGSIKEAFGKGTDNEQMRAEGRTKRVQGEAQKSMGQAKGRSEGASEKAKGQIKQKTGRALGNEQMQAEGHITEKKGEVRQRTNDSQPII